ncbi:DUF1620 super [Lobaria immixta]|nr:DUF1620 super [Lobaria immixta]
MRSCPAFYVWLLVLFIPSLALAIFADEAYHIDYHHALLGTPQSHTTFFHRPSAISKASLLYTLSNKFVLGAINPKDGSIVWRQRLVDRANNETGEAFLSAADGENTIYSAINDGIHAWDAADGRLVWDWRGTGRAKALEVFTADGGQKYVLALYVEEGKRGIVRKLAADTGEVLWELKDDSGDTPFGLSLSKGTFHYISLHPSLLKGYKIKITALDPMTGVQSAVTTLSSDHEVTSPDSILFVGTNHVSPLIIWTDRGFKTVKVNLIGKKYISSINVRLRNDEEIEKIFIHAPRTVGAPSHFLVHYQTRSSHWAEIYHANLKSGTVEIASELPTMGGFGAFATSTQGTNVYFTRNTHLEGTLVSSVQNGVLGHWSVRPRGHGGSIDPQGVQHAVSEVVAKGVSNFAVRSALVLPSGDWELLQNGKTLWMRPEGLAGVVAAAFIDRSEEALAGELALESHSSVFTAYLHRLKRHARDLRHLPGWAQSLPTRIRRNVSGEKSPYDIQGQFSDSFGFQKLVIVATERGRLMALNTGNQGEVMWSTQLIDLPVQEKWEVTSIEAKKGTALVRGKEGEIWRIETLTGKTIEHQPAGLLADLKTAVSVLDASGGNLLVPVRDDGFLGDYPETKLPEGTLIVTQATQGTLRGWSLTSSAKPALAWEFVPAPQEIVTTVVARPAHDPVASIGKALGDRNVLYKFLNPNVLFVATVNFDASTATIYVLDSASGQILHTTLHSNVDTSRSITATMSENWFAYTIFSDTIDLSQDGSKHVPQQSKGFQLVISELFESEYPNDRGPLGSLQNFSSIYPFTSERGETSDTPYVVSQAYSIPGPMSLLSVTSTVQGITPRSILCFLPSLNALISIPRSVVDPRRPVGRDPVPAELEEGLFRYTALLEFDPKWVISHQRDILSLLKVVTSPSLLESTSLVFAFGDVDIFGTRVAPIGGFDLLGKGFSKLQLVGTVVALAVGTGVLAPMVRKKQIDGRWKI